ncbi:hypothetical protein [Sphingomicrobium marinum]|uniref:hypothetical protein n=1 Tax=Sphingomicrobium marinum TaxID=1227950 RepID=UPI002240D7EF|nr:hypothetical protein [Sphingomicrobium marinum]
MAVADMKAVGRVVVIIEFDADAVQWLRVEQIRHLEYHVGRLLTGEETAESEWTHLGYRVAIEPDMDQGDD